MNRVHIDQERCKACRLCMSACRLGLLTLDKGLNAKGYHPIMMSDASSCVACAQCALLCPEGAISVYKSVKSS